MPFIIVTDAEMARQIRVNIACIGCYYTPDLATQAMARCDAMLELTNEDLLGVSESVEELDHLIQIAEASAITLAQRALELRYGPATPQEPLPNAEASGYDVLRFTQRPKTFQPDDDSST